MKLEDPNPLLLTALIRPVQQKQYVILPLFALYLPLKSLFSSISQILTCKFSTKDVKAKVAGSNYFYADATIMIAALNTQGILSVAVYATSNFQSYQYVTNIYNIISKASRKGN